MTRARAHEMQEVVESRGDSQRPPMAYVPYEVRLHLYQGRDLPPLDANGLLDPYVVALVGGRRLTSKAGRKRSAVEAETLNPTWYDTLRVQVWLPADLSLAPPLVLEVPTLALALALALALVLALALTLTLITVNL